MPRGPSNIRPSRSKPSSGSGAISQSTNCRSTNFSGICSTLSRLPAGRAHSPYVGLVPYAERDGRFFFGRENDQRVVVANLFASRMTLLYGASGVGKSSLLRAGVVKHLRHRMATALDAGERP